jgi:AmmeMemoRadiSam system protein B
MAIKVREMIGANVYYPKDKEKLSRMINGALKNDAEKIDKNPFAIISPYGHYLTALQIYAASYKQILKKKYDTIIILGPVHKIAFPAIALADYDEFATPLGNLTVDKDASEVLRSFDKKYIINKNKYHDAEYCIENQLPFISLIFGNKVKILPVLLGEVNTKFTIMLANALKRLFDKAKKDYLIIAATNLSTDLKYDDAVKMDNNFADYLINFNPDRLSEQLSMNEIRAKGGGCVVALQRFAKLANHDNLRVIRLANSGDFSEDKDKVEGYISAVIW